MEFLNLKVFGEITIGMIAGGVVGLFVLSWLLRKLMSLLKSQSPTGPHETRMRCPDCNWVGVVSTYKPVCKKCGNIQLRRAG